MRNFLKFSGKKSLKIGSQNFKHPIRSVVQETIREKNSGQVQEKFWLRFVGVVAF